eukprot:TRINITY_DN3819_c0_g2_i1.p1 TRINITY_DN3819_c0_g2~~TRINITY_DN3819_c0_g2_i1.p1  ORF type:complete len:195 (-),score=12.65 TRINITY_DN3819_c0_g2_i1:9-593(-)
MSVQPTQEQNQKMIQEATTEELKTAIQSWAILELWKKNVSPLYIPSGTTFSNNRYDPFFCKAGPESFGQQIRRFYRDHNYEDCSEDADEAEAHIEELGRSLPSDWRFYGSADISSWCSFMLEEARDLAMINSRSTIARNCFLRGPWKCGKKCQDISSKIRSGHSNPGGFCRLVFMSVPLIFFGEREKMGLLLEW